MAIGQIPVKRGEIDRKPLMTAVGVLKDGGVVGIFPEGTRGAGDVGAAERGAAWLVRASGATVLPVATRGTLKPAGRQAALGARAWTSSWGSRSRRRSDPGRPGSTRAPKSCAASSRRS